ncbi:DNA-dependent protein kinase catalytic subunit isoform X1 [Scyliorhinus canicula]|uniref:DNA-dependent protein kinase catalytic subunit isoform X1 n=1 Tax=Scyliorhinus canicula TaxID=7830 RepID=UPI0018F775FC|nr:DNA-dependent protein kinase catalytic subunit isoform X1 [Scyliorhinus canicula]
MAAGTQGAGLEPERRLQQLQQLLSASDSKSAAMTSLTIVTNLSHDFLHSGQESRLALHSSLMFSKDEGLLIFLRKSLSNEDFRDCRDDVLKLITAFVEKIKATVGPYAVEIKDICLVVYTKERAAKCKAAALDLLLVLLHCKISLQDFKIGEIFNKFYGELAQKSKLPDTVLEKVYELLGVLAEVQPTEMLDNSEKLFRAYLSELKTQMTSATREPKLLVVSGCLRGLIALMVNFTKSVEEDPKTSKEIFDYAMKAINLQVDIKRYAVPLAGLRLFTLHASQFSTCLMDSYQTLFEMMSKWCGHSNAEMKKGGYAALESFLKEIALQVAENAHLHKDKLQYFMQQFYDIIRTMESSTKELSIAIRGYGLFAAPCKAVNSQYVDFMYTELIQRCKQMYLTEADTEDDNVYQLPSFLDSLASVIFHIDKIPGVYTSVLERLLVVQIDSFPQYSVRMQPVCCHSIVKLFIALAGKGPVLWNFISTVVHQGLIRVCSKPVLLPGEGMGKAEPWSNARQSLDNGSVAAGKWRVPSYKDYLELFRSLLDCGKMKEFGLVETFQMFDSPLKSLNQLLYDEFIKSVLKIIEKLDLTVDRQSQSEEGGSGDINSSIVIPTSDPAANLQPTKPKDFTALFNLVEFCGELLLEKHTDFFEQWVYRFGHELILRSTQFPLVSGFYKLLSVTMKIAQKINYFEGVGAKTRKQCPKSPDKFACFALFGKFGKEVAIRMKQYKDELLASCLTFVLSLPHDIIALDIKTFIPALQTAFKLGLSHIPLADVGLDALEHWSIHISKHAIEPYYKDILPHLDGYLKTASNEIENNWEMMSVNTSSKGGNKVLIRRLKNARDLSMNEESPAAAVRRRVVRLLGSLGGQINRSLVAAATSEEMMKKCVAWVAEGALSFAVPFADMKPVIYLDSFLPHISELALSANDRQTKVAACELLHSVVTYMLGKGSQISEGQQETMYKLNKHMFPVLLRLGCDVDKVTNQLFEPLVLQLIHWFTNNKKFESRDTVALLEAILDGIVDPVDSTLRDFCGNCVQEFLKWSIKQTTPEQQQKSPVNTKSLFKRLYSLALHPNTFKRLGAALAFNSLYREFREENALVEQFVFEVLVVYLESLALAHSDDKSLGTVQQCSDSIDHLKRIIKQKARALNEPVKRRVPRGFSSDQMVCLTDIVMWLLAQCGRPQTECRHKCMELFYELVPLLPGNKTPSSWLDEIIKTNGVSFLVNKFEGAGNEHDKCSGIIFHPTFNDLQQPFSVRAALQWMDMLLAALDCYNTFIGLHLIKPNELLGTYQKSGFMKALHFFLKNLAMRDITAAEECFAYGIKGILFSPREREEYNYSKCTIIVRIMEFVSMVLESCEQDLWKVLEKDLLSSNLFELVAIVVTDPPSIGFNMADVQVMKGLPDISVRLLKAVLRLPYRDTLESNMRKQITPQSIEGLCNVDLYRRTDHDKLSSILLACKQLHKAGLLNSVLMCQTGSIGLPLNSKLLSTVYKGIAPGDERKSLPSIDNSSKMLADGLLQLSFSLGGQCEELVSLLLNTVELSVPLSGASQRHFISFSHGEYFYNLFPETINGELLRNLNSAVTQLMGSTRENPKMVSIVLNGMLDQSFKDHTVRKTQGILLVNAVLKNWAKLDSWWLKDSIPESKMAVLTLLSKVLQIDSSVSYGNSHEAFSMVFQTYTTILTDSTLALNLKTKAVIILPFFTHLPEENLRELKNALNQFIAAHFPMKSDEFPKGTLRYNNYIDCVKKLLDALELSQSPLLLKILTEVLCRDSKHVMEEAFQICFQNIVTRGTCEKQVVLLEAAYEMFRNEEMLPDTTRQFVLDRSLLTLILRCSPEALREFFCKIVKDAMEIVQSRFIKISESSFDNQLTKKIGCYKLFEVMYGRLPKNDVYTDTSKIIEAFHSSGVIEGNRLSKTLLKSCYDAVTENMAGETQLLEKRRQYHCAAYNCMIAVLCCIFTEAKFYQGFLFSEKPEKNVFILENLIDVQRTYSFPVETEVPVEKKRRYFAIRKEAREATDGDSDEPHYLSSQSYMVDSSLSEEMSQFDFSTGVQSFSYSSQDPKVAVARTRKTQEWAESNVMQNDIVELEMDEMNQHECMATMTALVNHMQKMNITPKVEEGQTPHELPPWMKFLHGKLRNSATPLNIRLFIAKLIVNTEEIFQPYAQVWLGPLLQLVVSGNNGGDGIHYMVVEIVVTVLSWTSVATPKGNPTNEILADRLLAFLMKNSFHEKKAVFRHNLEIIKTVVECWKDCLSIPYSLIFERFAGRDPNTKDNSVGIQLLGIVLANNLPPYDPTCAIDSERYFQRLVHNISLTRYKEVYAAAAEVLGLVLQYLAEKQMDVAIHDLVVQELQQLRNTKEDKFIVCLNKIVKHFPPFADRFLNAVFFLLPKLYGVLKTHCLEVVMYRAEEIPDINIHLKSKDFAQIMSHRDEERQKVSLDIVYKIKAKLTPTELKEMLNSVMAFISHPSPICRERLYDILMWIYDNYRDPENQPDLESKEIYMSATDALLQGLTDENPALQLYVRNFWSHENRLPTGTLDRIMAILGSLYCNKIETQYLSIATNVLLEMTSHSPDYCREMFEYPLSECKFQDYNIDSSWHQRSRILTPLFVETQATPGSIRNPTQDASATGQRSVGGQIRATQTHYEFTPTQNPGARNFNWLTGNSLDTFAEYTLPSSESVSSSLLVYSKQSERQQRAAMKPVGPEFGKRRLAVPGDEVDSKTKAVADQRADILRLRRRFLKDREKESLIFARRNIREKHLAKEKKTEQKMKRDAQVTLYRCYRVGDLPDIQIKFSSLIAPLQALAQKDHLLAKQLFTSLFSGILGEVKKSKTAAEMSGIGKALMEHFNCLLKSTILCFPPFVTCIQDMSRQHSDLLNLDPSIVSTTALTSLQQPMGILLLELSLIHHAPPEEPPAKRARGRNQLPPDTARWVELAKLYRSLGDYDVLRGIFSEKIGTQSLTQKALLAEGKSDYAEAVRLYDQALNSEEWEDGNPTDAEKDFWEIAALECYSHLTEWKSLEYCSTVNISDKTLANLEEIWTDPFYQETYLPHMMRSKIKLLQLGEVDQSLLTFIDNAMKVDQRKTVIESRYSQELSLLYILQDDFDRAKYYVNNGIQIFMQNYSSIDTLLHRSRLTKLQSLQTLTEIQDFLSFITKGFNLTSEVPLRKLIRTWTSRYPESKLDPMSVWDDVITNRCFFLDKIKERLSLAQADDSMEVDDEGTDTKMDVDRQEEDINMLIRSCKFNMKLRMSESASKQNNFSVSTKLLKELHKESKDKNDWRMRWIQSYSRFSHKRCRSLDKPEQIVTVMKTIPLLVEAEVDTLNTQQHALRDQNTLLGTTYHIMANALKKDPSILQRIEEDRARTVIELSGATSGDVVQVSIGLYRKAHEYLRNAIKKVEEELQSLSEEHVDTVGLIKAYMNLANFCDKCLREEEESENFLNFPELQTFPACVVENMLKALKYNSREARLRFPRLLQIVELYPAETKDLMTRGVSSVPCWLFIGWISQMMAALDKEEASVIHHIIEDIADSYPQAIVYPFMISSENYTFEPSASGNRNKEFVERLKTKLNKEGVIENFINSLQQLSNPDLLFKDWVNDFKNQLEKKVKIKKVLKNMYDEIYSNLASLQSPGIGAFRTRYAKTFKKLFDQNFGKEGSKLLVMNLTTFNEAAKKIQDSINKESCELPGNLKEYSPWMSEFKPEYLRNELEIPGQYDGKSKPMPEYHARITGFDERIKVMNSIRKPKRLIIRGNDEKEYPFLVKGGEDLRQDQRIEQLFDIMNIILSRDAACSQRGLQLKTYQVIPMTSRLGLIEWLNNTCVVKNFLLSNVTEDEHKRVPRKQSPKELFTDWLQKISGPKTEGLTQYGLMYMKASRTETVKTFRNCERAVPQDLLRRAFTKMSTTPEAFLTLRSHFASSHALMCVSHWILGIGDRHLSNFMINLETGGMVGIDFGHAFGSATQFLSVPELMPFRLTNQFLNLMLPMKESGLLYSTMVHGLRAFRLDPDLLLSTMDVFVKEPSLDWKNLERNQLKKEGSWSKEVNTNEINWYPKQKVNCAKRKLEGANPFAITRDELRLGHEKSKAYTSYIAVAMGDKDHNVRAREPEEGLSVECQVDCLIDQATDPNILGRVWVGWEAWM